MVDLSKEPITLEDMASQLRLDDSEASEDLFLQRAIVDARGWVESYTGLILTRRQVTQAIPCFTATIHAWPIISIDSVAYVDAARQEVTLPEADYFAQIARRPAALVARSWPSIYGSSTVAVTMTAGFEGAAAINAFSPNIMRAMRILIAGMYADREGGSIFQEAEKSALRLCRSSKRWTV